MKEVAVNAYDDLDWHQHKRRTPATHTVTVGFEGRWVELDLTEAHTVDLAAFLAPYMEAGSKPGKEPTVRRAAAAKREATGRGYSTEAEHRNQVKAAWAKAAGLPVTHRKAGGYYFPVKTERAWSALPAAERAALLAGASVNGAAPEPVGAAT